MRTSFALLSRTTLAACPARYPGGSHPVGGARYAIAGIPRDPGKAVVMPENGDRSSRRRWKLRQAGAWAGAAAVYAAPQGLSAWAAQRQSGRGTRPQYSQFERPAFAPPGAAFPVVWSALNLTTATSAWRIWRAPGSAAGVPSRGEVLAWWAAAVVIRSGYVPLAFGRRRLWTRHCRRRAPVRGHGALCPAGPPDRPARGAARGSRGCLDGIRHGAQRRGCRDQRPVRLPPGAAPAAQPGADGRPRHSPANPAARIHLDRVGQRPRRPRCPRFVSRAGSPACPGSA